MTHPSVPAPPRVCAPDLPRQLGSGVGLSRGGDYVRLRWTALDASTDADHATISECELTGASVDALGLTGASLIDVDVRDLRAAVIIARSARLRRVRITGGRIGTLDLTDADLDEVEIRGARIDYLSLAAARVTDFLITETTIETIDVPRATVTRMGFANARADEVDSRGLHAKDLDLRGLEALSYIDPASLRGATLSLRQVESLAPALAQALGIHVSR